MSDRQTDARIRVAMVCARALPLMGGIETHVHEVARRLPNLGVEIDVLTTTTDALPHADGADVPYTVERYPAYPRSRDYYFSPSLFRRLRQSQYDLVHVQGVHTLVPPMAILAAKLAKTPAVVTFHTGGHSNRARNAGRAVQWRILAPLLRTAARLIAVCEYEQHLFASVLGVPGHSVQLVRNGAEALPLDPTYSHPGGQPLVLSIGRLERYKGHDKVLRGFAKVLEREPGGRLMIVGSGPYEGELRTLSAGLGIADRVEIVSFGPTERAKLGQLVADADLVCLLSEYEAHPVAVMEALGTGTRVLAADTSGLSELGRAGIVTTIPINSDARAIADSIIDVAAAPPIAATKLASWDDCAMDLARLYAEVAR